MRRSDREVKDINRINEIIDSCDCIRLGLYDGNEVYIVPMSFGYDKEEKSFYFHSSKEGRKIDVLKEFPNVSFELDTSYKLVKGDIPCRYSCKYQSVMGKGVVSFVEDVEEKRSALIKIMNTTAEVKDWQFIDVMVNSVAIFKLEITDISGKENM